MTFQSARTVRIAEWCCPAGAGMVISFNSQPKSVSFLSRLVRFEMRNATLAETADEGAGRLIGVVIVVG